MATNGITLPLNYAARSTALASHTFRCTLQGALHSDSVNPPPPMNHFILTASLQESIAAFFPASNFPVLYQHKLPLHHCVRRQEDRMRPQPVLAIVEWDVCGPAPKILMVSSYCNELHIVACGVVHLELDADLLMVQRQRLPVCIPASSSHKSASAIIHSLT